jgi:hypothetical protein
MWKAEFRLFVEVAKCVFFSFKFGRTEAIADLEALVNSLEKMAVFDPGIPRPMVEKMLSSLDGGINKRSRELLGIDISSELDSNAELWVEMRTADDVEPDVKKTLELRERLRSLA